MNDNIITIPGKISLKQIKAIGSDFPSDEILKLPYDVVDLGLPSGTLWCTQNLNSRRNPYNISDVCFYSYGNVESYSTFNTELYNNHYSGYYRDAASEFYGWPYSLPSKEDFEELFENCTRTIVPNIFGIVDCAGIKFTSKINGNYIYIPCFGERDDNNTSGFGSYGSYWTSTVDDSTEDAYYAEIWEDYPFVDTVGRIGGKTIRPVIHKEDILKKNYIISATQLRFSKNCLSDIFVIPLTYDSSSDPNNGPILFIPSVSKDEIVNAIECNKKILFDFLYNDDSDEFLSFYLPFTVWSNVQYISDLNTSNITLSSCRFIDGDENKTYLVDYDNSDEEFVLSLCSDSVVQSSTSGLRIEVVQSMPANPDSNTIYIVQ